MKPVRFNFTRYELPELIDLMRLKTGVEVGVNLGQFSYHLLKYSKIEHLIGVDVWRRKQQPLLKGAKSYLGEFGRRATLVRQESVAYAAKCEPVDFVYIDAAHDFPNVRADLAAWVGNVKSGGILAGHDYTAEARGVIEAVDQFAARTGWQLFLTREVWASWLFFVP
jgi:predicted O-methyltransferase YrrM